MLAGNLFQLVITELELPDTSGLAILDSVLEQDVVTPVIFTAKSGSVERAVEAMRQGRLRLPGKARKPGTFEFHGKKSLGKGLFAPCLLLSKRHEQPYLYRLASISGRKPGHAKRAPAGDPGGAH